MGDSLYKTELKCFGLETSLKSQGPTLAHYDQNNLQGGP